MGWRKKFFFLSQAGSPFLIYSDFHRQPSYYSTNCLVFTTLGRCANSQQPWIVKTHKEQSQGSPGNQVSLVMRERGRLIGMWAGYCSPLWPLQRRDSGCSWIGVNEVGCHVDAPGKPPPPPLLTRWDAGLADIFIHFSSLVSEWAKPLGTGHALGYSLGIMKGRSE